MSKVKRKSRKSIIGAAPLLPYKILILLLYGNYEFVQWAGNKCLINVSKFCTHHGIHRHRFYEYVDQLYDMGFLTDYAESRGSIAIQLHVPAKFAVNLRDFMSEEIDVIKLKDTKN